MIATIAGSVVGAAITAVIGYVYVNIISKHLNVAAIATDKAGTVASAQGFFQKTEARLENWKTIILAWIAGAVQVFSFITTDVIQGWQQLPWAQVFDAKIANWITIVCAVLIPVVHAQGIAKAAVTPPVEEPPPAQTP